MKKYFFIINCVLLFGFSYFLKAQTVSSEYMIANKFHIEGDGGWDYLNVDESTGRIFVSHGNVVNVIDEKDGKLLGAIPDTKGVHGIAIAADLNKAFISNGRDSSVTIIDLKSLAFITKVPVTGQNPDAILFDPFSHNVFVYNGRTANATVIDGKTDKVIATIKLSGKPENSVTNLNGKVYVNIEGDGCDGAAFDPELKRAYSSNGEGTMTVVREISPDQFKVLENAPTVRGARTKPHRN